MEVLGLKEPNNPLFRIFAGTSVGAINAAFMVANAHRADLGVFELANIYRNLSIQSHLRIKFRRRRSDPPTDAFSRSLLDARPLELLVRRSINFDSLHRNLDNGLTTAVMIAAFNLVNGCTTIFAHTAPGAILNPSKDPRRVSVPCALSADHVLASAAIPLLFPPRRIGDAFFCDGGVRFNTPISPAIRAGADRLLVISLQPEAKQVVEPKLDHYPSTPFVAGKLLNALLLDPFQYDLEVMQRFNQLVDVMDESLRPEERKRVDSLLTRTRGAPYRKLDTLVFMPSQDLGRIANEHLRAHLESWQISSIPRFLMRRAALEDATWEADWAAYLMFDGGYAGRLVDLGLEDAHRRADDIRAFFT